MQVALPIFTALLAGGAALWFGQISKALDRRRQRLDAKAAVEAERACQLAIKRAAKLPSFWLMQLPKGYSLANGQSSPSYRHLRHRHDYPREKVKGLPGEPFTLGALESITFRLPGTKDLIEMPQMWIMCDQYANPVPVYVGMVMDSP